MRTKTIEVTPSAKLAGLTPREIMTEAQRIIVDLTDLAISDAFAPSDRSDAEVFADLKLVLHRAGWSSSDAYLILGTYMKYISEHTYAVLAGVVQHEHEQANRSHLWRIQ